MRPRRESRDALSDAELLARIARGDVQELGPLYDRHYPAVLRFATRVTGRVEEAEDVVQEAFLIAARNASTFDGRSSARPWLFGIVSRIVLQRNRAGVRLSRFVRRLSELGREAPRSPEVLHEQRQLNRTLVAALDTLSPPKRVVLVMAESEELSCDEIASALGIPVGTVWTRLHYARKELRAHLERRLP